jgi:simple sugar transport system ATP-binding protein
VTLLSLAQVRKTFGSTLALDNVALDVAAGEVHALLGENGAGKSTLMQVAYGLVHPDAGSLELFGSPRAMFRSPAEARAAGIGMVHQHFTSIPALSVGENIALAAGWHESGKRAERRAAAVIARLGLPLDPAAIVSALSVQLRQRLEVVKALAADPRVLLLDEPSAVLAPREVRELLESVREFAARGGAVVLITHKLEEVFAAADRVTVLRRGVVTFSGPTAGQTPATLARAMLGADLPRAAARAVVRGDVVVRAESFTMGLVQPVSFEIRAGEIVGVAAIEGNGQRELLRAIGGPEEVGATLRVSGPVAFVPEDRTTEGLIPEFSLAENVLLGMVDDADRWLNWRAIRARTANLLAEFDVRSGGPDAPASSLSGGNQQKLLFARAFERAPQVLVAEDPTRGLDILATHEIHERLREAASLGVAVIVHSSDLDEVLALADRVFVVANGIVREMPAAASRDAIGDAMLGVAPQ